MFNVFQQLQRTDRHTHTSSYLFLHVRHLHRGFVPQLIRKTQVHFHPFVDQVLQSRHGLTGALQYTQTRQLLAAQIKNVCKSTKIEHSLVLDLSSNVEHTGWATCQQLYLGISEATRPLCMNIILQDAFTKVVYRLSQPSFPANQKKGLKAGRTHIRQSCRLF